MGINVMAGKRVFGGSRALALTRLWNFINTLRRTLKQQQEKGFWAHLCVWVRVEWGLRASDLGVCVLLVRMKEAHPACASLFLLLDR